MGVTTGEAFLLEVVGIKDDGQDIARKAATIYLQMISSQSHIVDSGMG